MKQNDFTILAMICCLVLGLAFDVVFYSFNAMQKNHDEQWDNDHFGLG
jgi:hypothetical protein